MPKINLILGIIATIFCLIVLTSVISYITVHNCFAEKECKNLLKKFIDNLFKEEEIWYTQIKNIEI